jgi:hypothetical protein
MGLFSALQQQQLSIRTINTTQTIAGVSPADVWPLIRAMEEWSNFQNFFRVELVGGGLLLSSPSPRIVEVGQRLLITSQFAPVPQHTLEELYVVDDVQYRICWTLQAFVVPLLWQRVLLRLPTQHLLQTSRCIELFQDHSNNSDSSNNTTTTILHNWITYRGILWPMVILLTGVATRNLFQDFNSAVAEQFF